MCRKKLTLPTEAMADCVAQKIAEKTNAVIIGRGEIICITLAKKAITCEKRRKGEAKKGFPQGVPIPCWKYPAICDEKSAMIICRIEGTGGLVVKEELKSFSAYCSEQAIKTEKKAISNCDVVNITDHNREIEINNEKYFIVDVNQNLCLTSKKAYALKP